MAGANGRARAALAVAAVLAAFAATAAAFALPGRLRERGWDTEAYRYADLDDGDAFVMRSTTDGGEEIWESASVSLLPGLTALGALPVGLEQAVARQLTGDADATTSEALQDLADVRDTRVFQLNRRELAADGRLTSRIEVWVADDAGITTVGGADAGASGPADVFEPGIVLLPADPEPGTTWGGQGTFGDFPYEWDAEVVEAGTHESPVGTFDDCVTTRATLAVTPEGASPISTTFTDTWCDGTGNLATDADGDRHVVYERLATLEAFAAGDLPPPGGGDPDAASTGPAGAPADWAIRRAGSVLPPGTVATSTFAPLYVPAEEPVVLTATEDSGDVVALGVGEDLGTVRWRISTGGATYSRPRWDADRHRLYFGASDGFLRAVDDRGFFLWGAAADDAIGGTPVLVDDQVVFGSEDGKVRAVDAGTGEEQWASDVEAPVASGGAELDGLAVVADTAGVVRAYAADGDVVWSHTVAAAVEAPLAAVPDGGVLVADRAGGVTRLDGAGDAVWTADAGRGTAVHWQPVVVGDLAVAVDDFGTMTALGLHDGSIRWRHGEQFTGAVAAVGDVTVAATETGHVVAFDPEGREVARVDAADARSDQDVDPTFTYGPSVGGGALWVADDVGIVRTVGDGAGLGPAPLTAAWLATILEPPFSEHVVATPVPRDDHLLVTDLGRRLLALDPGDGAARLLGSFGEEEEQLIADPVLAGDTLVVDLGARVAGISPDDAALHWEVPLEGLRVLPPAVAGGVAVVVSETPQGAELVGIDVASGEVLWRRATGAPAMSAGAVVDEDEGVVYAGSPVVALDVATGELRWTTEVTDPFGGLAADGEVVVVPTHEEGGRRGAVTVLDAGTGDVRWRLDLGADGVNLTGRALLAGDVVVVPSVTGDLIGLGLADGEERWRRPAAGELLGSAALLDGGITFARGNGQVVVVDPATGEAVATFEGLGTDIGATSVAQQPVELDGTITVVAGEALFGVRAAS